MCGIIGFSGQFTKTSLLDGLHRISHRGPDGSGTFFNEEFNIGIGHTRLSIIELSDLGHQPMQNDDGSVVLSFNGEIYNFRILRVELEKKGIRFKGDSDTEVLLQLYLQYGEEAVKKLKGIFSFAIWNKNTESLFLARDGLGVKPLYYATTSQGFIFSSELKALLAMHKDPKKIDPVSLHRYMSFLWCPGEGTLLKGIYKLPPGESMWVKDGVIIKKSQWYTLPCFNTQPEKEKMSVNDAVTGTYNNLNQAVERQMVSDVPLGTFLSGGLDSSSIAACASKINPKLSCFTIKVKGELDRGFVDDYPYAKKVAKHLKLPLIDVEIDSNKMAQDIEKMVYMLDEPLADPAALNVLYISKIARDMGIKVLLSGVGGDDIFTGYRRHIAARYDKLWNFLPSALVKNLDEFFSQQDQKNSSTRRLTKLLNGIGLDKDHRLANYFSWAREKDLLKLYSDDFLSEVEKEKADAPFIDFLQSNEINEDLGKRKLDEPLEKLLALDQRFFLGDHNLVYTDKMSMAAGLEVRVPFLDQDLMQFAAEIPLNLKLHNNTTKWVLKKAMEPFLPKDIIYRKKTGFGAPVRNWISSDLKELVNDYLSYESLSRRGIFNPDSVRSFIEDNQSGRLDGSYTILSMLCIEIWCRNFLDSSNNYDKLYSF